MATGSMSIYSFIILGAVYDVEYRALYDIAKLVSLEKEKKVTIQTIRKTYLGLFRNGYIDFCEGPESNKHKYIKITPLGRNKFLELESQFKREYRFMQKVYEDIVINKDKGERNSDT